MVAVAAVAGGFSIVAGSGEDDSAGQEPGLDQPPGEPDPESEHGDAGAAAGGTSGPSQGDARLGGEAGGSVADPPALGDATSPPTGGWIAFHDELAQSCHDGNMFDCDYLYGSVGGVALPDSQPHKDYAGTCGGRIGMPANGECEAWYGSTL